VARAGRGLFLPSLRLQFRVASVALRGLHEGEIAWKGKVRVRVPEAHPFSCVRVLPFLSPSSSLPRTVSARRTTSSSERLRLSRAPLTTPRLSTHQRNHYWRHLHCLKQPKDSRLWVILFQTIGHVRRGDRGTKTHGWLQFEEVVVLGWKPSRARRGGARN
jgi:hypothetical protein